MIELEGQIESSVPDVPVGQLDVSLPGLIQEIRNTNDQVIEPSNLGDLAEEAKAIFAQKSWYRSLLRDVRQHKKSAIFVVAMGGIIIFVATAAGFEFGVRHGQDLRHLPKILRRK